MEGEHLAARRDREASSPLPASLQAAVLRLGCICTRPTCGNSARAHRDHDQLRQVPIRGCNCRRTPSGKAWSTSRSSRRNSRDTRPRSSQVTQPGLSISSSRLALLRTVLLGQPPTRSRCRAGHPFRFTVLNVKGKTVVVLVGSLVLTQDEFGGFVSQADRVLMSLKFPN